MRDRYFRLTQRAPGANEHHLYFDSRLAKADHSFTGQTRMDLLAPDGVMKLTIDTIDDAPTTGRFPAVVTRTFYYEIIQNASVDLIREIESEHHVRWSPVIVNEFGDGRDRMYSVIEMRDIIRWPELVGIWRREISVSIKTNNTVAMPRNAPPSSNEQQKQEKEPTIQQEKMHRVFATLTPKPIGLNKTNWQEKASKKTSNSDTPSPSTASDSPIEYQTRKARETSWSPSPIAHTVPLLDDKDDALFQMIDEVTAAGGLTTSRTTASHTSDCDDREHNLIKNCNEPDTTKPKRPALSLRENESSEREQAEFPYSQKRQKTLQTPMVSIPVRRITFNIEDEDDNEATHEEHHAPTIEDNDDRQTDSETDPHLRKAFAQRTATVGAPEIQETELTDSEEEFMEASLRLDQANWARNLLFGKREPKNKRRTSSPLPPKSESWITADDEYGGSDVQDVEGSDNSLEVVDERGPTISQFVKQLETKIEKMKCPAEREAELAQAVAERTALKKECDREAWEAQRELDKAAKRASLKKALTNCEKFNSADGSDMPPPFETTGVSRYVINAQHRDYMYIMHRVTGRTEPNLYMRRQLGNSETSQHGYYILTTDMDLFEAAKKTEKGAVALRIPNADKDEEVLFFVRIVEPQKVSDHVYKQWGQATRQERIERDKLPGQRFYITVHVEPNIDFMIDPVELDTHTKFLNAVRHQLSDPDRTTKTDQLTDLSADSNHQRPLNRLALARKKPLDLIFSNSPTRNDPNSRPESDHQQKLMQQQQPGSQRNRQQRTQRPTSAHPPNAKKRR